MFIRDYLIPRLLQYFLVIFLGITIVFSFPALPTNPVERTPLRSFGLEVLIWIPLTFSRWLMS